MVGVGRVRTSAQGPELKSVWGHPADHPVSFHRALGSQDTPLLVVLTHSAGQEERFSCLRPVLVSHMSDKQVQDGLEKIELLREQPLDQPFTQVRWSTS